MSTHKFRAWDKVNKKMVRVWGINYKDFNNEIIESFFAVNPVINGEYILKAENAVLMQYSLVNDNKGIEIYEGDRVTCQEDHGMNGSFSGGPSYSGVIELCAGRFTLNMGTSHFDNWMDAPEIYVIGNIYETK